MRRHIALLCAIGLLGSGAACDGTSGDDAAGAQAASSSSSAGRTASASSAQRSARHDSARRTCYRLFEARGRRPFTVIQYYVNQQSQHPPSAGEAQGAIDELRRIAADAGPYRKALIMAAADEAQALVAAVRAGQPFTRGRLAAKRWKAVGACPMF